MPGDKSEKPTQQRLRKAREDGQYLSSRGMLTAVQFVAFVWVIGKIGPGLLEHLRSSMGELVTRAFQMQLTSNTWVALMRRTLVDSLSPLIPLGAVVIGSTAVLQLAMTRLGFNASRLIPNFSNLISLARMASMPSQNLKALLEALFLMGVLALGIGTLYREETALYLRIPFQDLRVTASQIALSIHGVLWNSCGVFVLFGAIDLGFQYRRYMSQLKMSKQDIRDEVKRSEGDLQTKARIRRLRRELLRRQMMKEVPQATAVIVNPTHYAIAIRYEMDKMSSPVVVAKGKNWLALRIRHLATQSEIPVIENPPLARALYDAAEIGKAISPEFYKAVAEILAYVYKLMDRKLQG